MKTFTLTKAERTNWITTEQVSIIIDTVMANPRRGAISDKLLTVTMDNSVHAEDYFKVTSADAIAALLNKLSAMDEPLQEIVGQLALKINYNLKLLNQFHMDYTKTLVAHQMLQTCIDLGLIFKRSTLKNVENPYTGKIEYRNQVTVTFGYPKDNKEYIHGVSLTAGVVYQKRYKVRAGGNPYKLSSVEKQVLREASSFHLRIAKDITPELFTESLKAQQDYINVSLKKVKNTDVIIANNNIKEAVAKLVFLQELEGFYLPMWIDYRTRLYYELSDYGLNPMGSGLAKYMYEAAEAYKITDSQRDYMKWSAVTIVDGRETKEESIVKYNANPEYYQEELRKTQYKSLDGKHLGDKLEVVDHGATYYNRRLADAILADESHFLLAYDATNGGLQGAAIGFKSIKMATASNLTGDYKVCDSHQTTADAAGVTRDEAKMLNNPLLHGASVASVARSFSMSTKEAKAMIISAYGIEALNISAIAKWGSDIANNDNTTLVWKTRDGLRAQSIYYTTGVPLTSYAATIDPLNISGYTQTKLHKEMPLLLDNTGKPVFGKIGEDTTLGGDVKVSGLYANIQHSNDAARLRGVMKRLRELGVKSAIFVHDNFLTGEHMDQVFESYQEELEAEYDFNVFDSAVADITTQYKGILRVPAPNLMKGSFTKEELSKARYFLSA